MKKLYKNLFVVAGLASISGYLAGLLTAKQSGELTRRDIVNTSKKLQSEAKTTISNLSQDLNNILNEAEAKIKEGNLSARNSLYRATKRADKVKSQSKEILTAISKGDADNKDLRRAISNLKLAISDLKDYLKS